MSNSPNDNLPEITRFDNFWWGRRNSMLVTLIMLAAVICGAFVFVRPLILPISPSAPPISGGASAGESVALVPSALLANTYYFSWAAKDQASDIYFIDTTITNSQPIQVTNTPDLSELWPMPSPIDTRLAFLAVTPKDERSLRVLDASQQNIDVTYNISGTGLNKKYQIDVNSPPLWSPDGNWLAFLGRSTDKDQAIVELFVAEVSSSTVYRLTNMESTIVSPRWADAATLIFAQEVNDHTLALFKIQADLRMNEVTPTSLGTIQK
jgi:hypothetical protein